MSAPVLAAVLLFANALFNVVAWPRFYPRIANDPRARDADGRRTRFYTVHVVLIVIALVLAAASAIAGVVVLL
ncbi:SCO4848 family membrane protein [Agromyces sp. NPDC057865]|uniref:SCO4848 family membrane protein n=1 Tax=Agromyces sp. NPDC057865 TaxID=3346267 RepID=UPI003670B9E5